jgi:transposase
METVAKKKPRRRRAFTSEFKAEFIERCQAGDRSVGQVARDFDLVESAVRRWVEQAEIDAGRREGLTSDEREELSRLRRENARLQADVDLLKRATAFMPMARLCRERSAGGSWALVGPGGVGWGGPFGIIAGGADQRASRKARSLSVGR